MKSYVVLLGKEEIGEVTGEGSPILSTIEQTVREKGHTLLPVGIGNIAKVIEWEPAKVWVPAIIEISQGNHTVPAFFRDRLLKKFKTAVVIAGSIEEVLYRFATASGQLSLFPRDDLSESVQAGIKHMLENLDRRKLTLAEIAKAAARSPSSIEALFRAELDTSVMGCLVELRVRQIKRLIRETKLANLGLGLAVGYSEKPLSEVFRRITGETITGQRKGTGN